MTSSLEWTRVGTRVLSEMFSGTGTFGVGSWSAESGLPGWTRAHVGAHLAANADALGNLVRWAATGEPTPMYRSAEQRSHDIEAGSTLDPARIVSWFSSSSAALDEAMAALTESQWQSPVVTAQGRTVPATEIPWMRAREVGVHAVDLATGFGFADLPVDFLIALIDDVVSKRNGQPADTGIVLVSDVERSWTVGDADEPTVVAAPLAELAGYLTGRVPLANAPALGPWL